MSHPINTEILEAAKADFDGLLAKSVEEPDLMERSKLYKSVMLIIEHLEEQGFKEESKKLAELFAEHRKGQIEADEMNRKKAVLEKITYGDCYFEDLPVERTNSYEQALVELRDALRELRKFPEGLVIIRELGEQVGGLVEDLDYLTKHGQLPDSETQRAIRRAAREL